MAYKTGLFAWLRTLFFRSMDVVVVPGAAAAEAVLGMGVRPTRILQGFNAVDVSRFHKAAVSPLHDDSDPAVGGHRYLYVGQLIHRKRVAAIIEAFVQVAASDDELTIVGAGALSKELRLLADRSGGRISFVEHIANSEMPAVMAAHHTLVLASEREVWGLVVNEALAAGMHVVVTDNCGVVPSVKEMRGVHTASEDLTDLAQRMQASKTGWIGRIAEPEILQYTPERFARVFDSAFSASAEPKRRRMGQT
jgi:glycosyltransferase involved in cell wall biosynthesis